MYLRFPDEKKNKIFTFRYKFCLALNQSFKSLVCKNLFIMRFRGRPFNI